jgi:hypothetical protein
MDALVDTPSGDSLAKFPHPNIRWITTRDPVITEIQLFDFSHPGELHPREGEVQLPWGLLRCAKKLGPAQL